MRASGQEPSVENDVSTVIGRCLGIPKWLDLPEDGWARTSAVVIYLWDSVSPHSIRHLLTSTSSLSGLSLLYRRRRHWATMATERLNSILSHLTPSKSGLSAMYVAFPAVRPCTDLKSIAPSRILTMWLSLLLYEHPSPKASKGA